jgi:hypothetical protein
MGLNEDAAARLVAFFLPVMALYFLTGIVLAVLYHLSLYYVDGEYRLKAELWLDIMVGLLRGLLYVFAWPVVLYFDRSALSRVKALIVYLNPRWREQDDEVQAQANEARRRNRMHAEALARERRERRREVEAETHAERNRLLREVHEGNPDLNQCWFLAASGTTPDGARELVLMYEPQDLAEEVRDKAHRETWVRSHADCPKCGSRVSPVRVETPDPFYLRVLGSGSGRPLLEGWAVAGQYRVTYEQCPECDASLPDRVGSIAELGPASAVVRDLKAGIRLHYDLP